MKLWRQLRPPWHLAAAETSQELSAMVSKHTLLGERYTRRRPASCCFGACLANFDPSRRTFPHACRAQGKCYWPRGLIACRDALRSGCAITLKGMVYCNKQNGYHMPSSSQAWLEDLLHGSTVNIVDLNTVPARVWAQQVLLLFELMLCPARAEGA